LAKKAKTQQRVLVPDDDDDADDHHHVHYKHGMHPTPTGCYTCNATQTNTITHKHIQ